MTKFSIRNQPPVNEKRTADARSQRQNDHQSRTPAAGAKLHLGDASRIGVVQHDDRIAALPLQQRLGIRADPFVIDIGRCQSHAMLHDRGKGTADRRLPIEMTELSWRPRLPQPAGLAGCGVSIRRRSRTNSPRSVSTIAPLMPEPPISMPRISIARPISSLLQPRSSQDSTTHFRCSHHSNRRQLPRVPKPLSTVSAAYAVLRFLCADRAAIVTDLYTGNIWSLIEVTASTMRKLICARKSIASLY